jgi:ribosomal protein L35
MPRPGRSKTNTAAKKRVKRSKGGKGKAMVEKAAHNHLLHQKNKRQKRKAQKPIDLNRGEAKKIERMYV